MLLVLDNCEHLTAACANLARQLLVESAGLSILATSRETLAVVGEAVYPLAGLAWPAEGDNEFQQSFTALELNSIINYDAVKLFVERSRAVNHNFKITMENVLAVIEICRKLDGLPLAVELASARTNILTVQEIASRLDNRLTLLTGGQITGAEPRHHTLRAAIDWSYELLDSDERSFFRRLAIFVSGCSLEMARSVCMENESTEEETLKILSSLVDKSLVIAETAGRSQVRYWMLETIREYALEKLNSSGEMTDIRNRHLAFFVSNTEEIAPKLIGPYQKLWFDWLENENDNIRAALSWTLEVSPGNDQIEAGLRVANAMYQFWSVRNYWQEGLAWYERLLDKADQRVPLAVHAFACTYAAFLAEWRGNSQVAIRFGRRAVELGESAGEEGKAILAFALGGLGSAVRVAGDYQAFYSIAERFIGLFRELGESYSYELSMGLLVASTAAMVLGKFDSAHAHLDEAITLSRAAGDPYRIAMGLNYLGDLTRLERQFSKAKSFYEESAAMLRDLGDERDLAGTLQNLGHIHLHQGNIRKAKDLFNECMTLQQAQHNNEGMAECLIGYAGVALKQNQMIIAARLLGAANSSNWKHRAWEWPATQMDYEEIVSLIRDQLGDGDFDREHNLGGNLAHEQVMEYVRQIQLCNLTGKNRGDLTKRELEIAALIAAGKTNREIAAELVLSKRTVEKHAANILSKLAFTNRSQVVGWVKEVWTK